MSAGLFYLDADPRDDAEEDARRDAAYERRRRARLNHWCDVCHGHTGPGSPCAPDPQPDGDGLEYAS